MRSSVAPVPSPIETVFSVFCPLYLKYFFRFPVFFSPFFPVFSVFFCLGRILLGLVGSSLVVLVVHFLCSDSLQSSYRQKPGIFSPGTLTTITTTTVAVDNNNAQVYRALGLQKSSKICDCCSEYSITASWDGTSYAWPCADGEGSTCNCGGGERLPFEEYVAKCWAYLYPVPNDLICLDGEPWERIAAPASAQQTPTTITTITTTVAGFDNDKASSDYGLASITDSASGDCAQGFAVLTDLEVCEQGLEIEGRHYVWSGHAYSIGCNNDMWPRQGCFLWEDGSTLHFSTCHDGRVQPDRGHRLVCARAAQGEGS